VSLSTNNWLRQQLPDEETAFLRRSRIELLVPIASSPERTQALIALGPKRSEEPYTAEDRSFLVAIASSLALLLERPAAAPDSVADAFAECPECGTCYDPGVANCTLDSTALISIGFSRRLADRYQLERRLGRGGMGTVYEATDTALERRVAAKVIREDLVGSAEAAQRFQREALATAAFAHPNVVTVHDFGVADNTRAFLVMELLSGVNLREEITQRGRLTAARALAIMRSVCAAVEAAHEQRLVHRDLKPENIFLVGSPTTDTAKVLDFGIAKFVSSPRSPEAETGAGILLGTWQYMPPEQLRGGTVQPAWDIWALSVVAYEMLTGQHPFAAATPEDSQSAVYQGRFTPLDSHLADAPAGASAFFRRAFAPEAGERPSTAGALLADVEHALRE
jgi:serine/threonine-protein kinase